MKNIISVLCMKYRQKVLLKPLWYLISLAYLRTLTDVQADCMEDPRTFLWVAGLMLAFLDKIHFAKLYNRYTQGSTRY